MTASRINWEPDAAEFSALGPAHRCAVGVGHVADRLRKLGALRGLPVVQVC